MKPMRLIPIVSGFIFSLFAVASSPVMAFDETWPYEEFNNANDCEQRRGALEDEQAGDFGLITSELGRGYHPTLSAQVSFYCYRTKGQAGALVYKVMKSYATYYYFSTIGPEAINFGRYAGTQYEDVYNSGITYIENGICDVTENGVTYQKQYIRQLSVTTTTPVVGYWPEGQGDQWVYQPTVGQPLILTNYISVGEDSQGNCLTQQTWTTSTTEYDDWSQLGSIWHDSPWWLD